MNAVSHAFFTSLIISFPLFIHTWGMLYLGGTTIDVAQTIAAAIERLWLLQSTTLLLSVPCLLRSITINQLLSTHAMLILAPLPFIVLAWLAAAVSAAAILKMLIGLAAVSSISLALALPGNRFRCFSIIPINPDMPLCLLTAALLWKMNGLWLSWLK